MAKAPAYTLVDRELSWLAFNERVLQEAEDPDLPVGDRIDFLAIVSSNLDEFFRVRVANLRNLLRLGKKKQAKLPFDPAELLRAIHEKVHAQQERFGQVLRESVLPDLREAGIALIDERELDDVQIEWLGEFFETRVRPRLAVAVLDENGPPPFLENGTLYLVAGLGSTDGPRLGEPPADIALVPIPAELPRFVSLPVREGVHPVMFLDDVVRLHLPLLFRDRVVRGAWSVKLTRDAELPIPDEFSVDLVKAIRKGLKKRPDGVPSRFLYDPALPHSLLARLTRRLELAPEDLIIGGRYHHLNDLFTLPRFDLPISSPRPAPIEALRVDSMFEAIAARDRLLHFPYQRYDPVVRFLDEAASDPAVESIRITLYRVARDSAVVDALESAARRGRAVTVFIELKARFDEQSNLEAGDRLERAGARVLYSKPGLKVHCKLALVERHEGGGVRRYAWLGTGNFNEKTARVYADHGLLTTDPRLTGEVRRVFDFLAGDVEDPDFEYLLVAPFTLRDRLRELVAAEADAAAAGEPSGITLKVNSLEDTDAIGWLYDADAAGVPIQLIVRGICRIVPEHGENIRARSIVDGFLEHARIYRFHARGEDRIYLASADWMTRNLDRRVEVAFPVLDTSLKAEIVRFLELQLADTVKARRLDGELSNEFVREGAEGVRSQREIYAWLRRSAEERQESGSG